MQNNEWKKTIQDKDLKEGSPQQVIVDEKKVMLVRIKGKIHACGNECSLVAAGDFKSFCRARLPSEVGSIPTHSRHSLSGFRPACWVRLFHEGE